MFDATVAQPSLKGKDLCGDISVEEIAALSKALDAVSAAYHEARFDPAGITSLLTHYRLPKRLYSQLPEWAGVHDGHTDGD